jgi:uncharacterized protein YdaU (DUF1376 family)
VAQRWYYQREPSAFLMATAHYDLETKGAYSTIVDLLNERDRPIPNEDRFISGILGCSPQKWRKIRDRLLDDGKLLLTEDGLHLTNPRFDRERNERQQQHGKAVEDGRRGGRISAARRAGQAELNLDEGFDESENRESSGKTFAKELQKSCESSAISLSRSEKKSPEINGRAQPPPQAPRARDSQSQSYIDSPPTSQSRANALDRPDLKDLLDRVCEAAGYRPTGPDQIARSIDFIKDLVERKIDFDEVVIPTIEAEIANSSERTRTLGRFRDRILHQHARRNAQTKQGKKHTPPVKPILSPDDEDPQFSELRAALLEQFGPRLYSIIFNPIRFKDVGPCQGNKRPLRLVGPSHLISPLRGGSENASTLLAIARAHGFTDIWA